MVNITGYSHKDFLDKDPSPVEGIQGHVPVFMETNNLGIYLRDEETSSSVLSNVYSEMEQAVYDSSIGLFSSRDFKVEHDCCSKTENLLKKPMPARWFSHVSARTS